MLTFSSIEPNTINIFRFFKKVTLRDIQPVLGSLKTLFYILPSGRPFLRRLTDLTIGISLRATTCRLWPHRTNFSRPSLERLCLSKGYG